MQAQSRASGFTLIEIMVVVVIIGLLATLVGPKVWQMLGFGQEKIALTKCQEYYNSAHTWRTIGPTKRFPNTLEELESPLREGEAKFIPKVEEDPWGNRYRLESDGKNLRVWSNGPDGIQSTEDDICYPALDDR